MGHDGDTIELAYRCHFENLEKVKDGERDEMVDLISAPPEILLEHNQNTGQIIATRPI